MFKIIESIRNEPIKLLRYTDNLMEPGSILSLVDGIYGDLCAGIKPFGVVADYPDERNMVPIWYDAMLFITDIFDQTQIYNEGNLLYVNALGQLTNQKLFGEDSYLVGFVSQVISDRCLEINWI